MKEILFRGKKKDTKRWIEGYYAIESNHACFASELEYTHFIFKDEFMDWGIGGLVQYEVLPETVGQYTGLTDKNGKKIFEGDIIKSCEYDDVYFVEYCADDDYPAFDVVPEMNVECNGLSHLHIVEGIEVIGNIHDNPELLKGGAEE